MNYFLDRKFLHSTVRDQEERKKRYIQFYLFFLKRLIKRAIYRDT